MGEGRGNVAQDDNGEDSNKQMNLAHSNDGGVGGGNSPTHVMDVWIAKDSLNGNLRGEI